MKIENAHDDAKIWAYLGVVGGAGVSSLAVQTAYELATLYEKADQNVCLVDLDFERGSCAQYLDIPASLHLEDLNAGQDRMDAVLAATFLRHYSNNLSVIAPRAVLGGNDLVSADAFLSLLDIICTMFDHIVLDIPAMWRPWSEAAVGAADRFSLVTELQVPALHKTKSLSEQICAALDLETPPDILINKYERRAGRNSLIIKDAHSVIGRTDIGNICVDEDTVQAAINEGKPAGKIRPESRYVKSVRAHVLGGLGEEFIPEKQNIRLFRKRA